MFDDEVVRAVAVEISDRHAIDASHVVAQPDAAIARQRRALPDVAARGRQFASVHDGRDTPRRVARRHCAVDEIGRRLHGRGVQALLRTARAAVHVERDVRRIRVEQTPAQIHASAIDRKCDQPSIE
jgi:hypothetical protein